MWHGYRVTVIPQYVGIINEIHSKLLALQRNLDISPAMLCVIVATSVQKDWIKLE